MSLSLVTGATLLPHTIDEIKAHARVEDDQVDEDGLLMTYYRAALAHLEGEDGILGRALLTQTWDLRMDRFPWSDSMPILVPLSPLASVTSITYTDTDGTSQTWAASKYDVDANSEPGRIVPSYGESYPATRDEIDAVTVRFVAGYGAARASVPEPIRLALLALTAHWYEERVPIITGTIVSRTPFHVDQLVAPYRVRL